MSILDKLIESFLIEAGALTKGSQRVMADKKLVAGLADAVRDDAQSNPPAFPAGSKNNFKKATDEAVAQWFLENIDNIEKEGYEGIVYSRDGVNSDWIVRRYIAGSHSWEDLTGVMNMNLCDWYLLKNRNLLDANHKDLPKFNSVRDVGYYMTTHYKDQLEKIRDAAKNAARNKMAKNIKLVDNDDYRIYTTLNRAAGCALGLGTQWCTANSNTDSHYHRYSDAAMLFQVFPYATKEGVDGEPDELVPDDKKKFQFDAGGPNFMDITDNPVRPETVRTLFPYLFSDLSKALKTNKSKMEKTFAELSADPTLQGKDFKIKQYEIDEEIKKLHKFVDRGYFTDEVRPSAKSADDTGGEHPEVGAAPALEQPPQEPQMESLKDLARAMMEDKTLGHIVQQYKPLNADGEESPMTYGEDNLDEEEFGGTGLEGARARLQAALSAKSGMVDEDDAAMMQDPAAGGEIGAQAATGGTLGGGAGGGQYPPGTAPTMPESVQEGEEHEQNKDAAQKEMDARSAEGEDMSDYEIDSKTYAIKKKENTMENVDKDVAAMMASLKKYDKLNESVLGMVTLSKAKMVEAEEVEEDAVDDFKAKGGKVKEVPYKDDKEEKGKSMGSKHYGKGGQGSKGAVSGLKARVNSNESVTEAADADVLAWMTRFAKLGNMKGYGK